MLTHGTSDLGIVLFVLRSHIQPDWMNKTWERGINHHDNWPECYPSGSASVKSQCAARVGRIEEERRHGVKIQWANRQCVGPAIVIDSSRLAVLPGTDNIGRTRVTP